MSSRTVRAKYVPRREDIADLVTRRPVHPMEQLNPFLFINHHGPQVYPPGNHGLPFGPHPHRGFETLTFIVDGSLVHRDTAGHESSIQTGGVQWMTAGRGIEHSETSSAEFMEEGGPLEILQLWINLPAALKMTEPAYRGLQREDIPEIAAAEGRASIHLIAGEWDGQQGPIESLTGLTMLTATLQRGAQLTFPASPDRVVFLYVVRGAIVVHGEEVSEGVRDRREEAAAFELIEMNADGDAVEIEATEDALLIFGHAQPLTEPIAAYGPFVMNTQDEIRRTVRDYQSGAFG